jgi:hypothetical protein
MIGSGRVALEQLVFHYADPVFSAALFSDQNLVLESNVLIDSFNPDLGTYASQAAALGTGYVDAGAVVISNGDIVVKSSTNVYGDVHAGESSDLTRKASSSVDGTIQNLTTPRPLPPVTEPVLPQTMPWTVPGGGSSTLSPGLYGFTSVSVGTGAQATIRGPATLVVDDFGLRSNSTLTFDTSGGPIALYISGAFSLDSNSAIVTPGASAADLSLYLTGGGGQTAVLNSNSKYHGSIYAPGVTVDIRSNFEVFGAVAAGHVIVNSNVRIHFDESLRALGQPNEQFEAATWSPTGFPIPAFSTDRRDPFLLVGRPPGELPAPADAHEL